MWRGIDRAALAVGRAAYDLEVDSASWIRGILKAAWPATPNGLGLIGGTFEMHESGVRFSSAIESYGDVPAGLVEVARRIPESFGRQKAAAFIRSAPYESASAAYEAMFPGMRYREEPDFADLRALGIHDQVALRAFDPTGRGFILVASLKSAVEVPKRIARRWERSMAHVLAGLRLRTKAARPAEAIVEPGGRVVHAEGPARAVSAREALRRAALDHDRARRKRSDPAEALGEWRALAAGRWSLLDTFESDGRRYLVATRNDPALDSPRSLSERERQVLAYTLSGHTNKYIAYALGIAPSTVSSHLGAAMRQLGARTRTELLEMWAAEGSSFFTPPERTAASGRAGGK